MPARNGGHAGVSTHAELRSKDTSAFAGITGGVTTAWLPRRRRPDFSFWLAIKVPALHVASTFILCAVPEHAEAQRWSISLDAPPKKCGNFLRGEGPVERQLEAHLLAFGSTTTYLLHTPGILLLASAERPDMATILIVEDEPQISSLLQSFVEEQGHRALSAATVDEALAILNGPEVVDALFVDMMLKGEMRAGIEFAKRAIELKPDLKVLYSTGLTVTDDMKASVVPGSIILEKPYSEDQLFNELIRPFSGRSEAHARH